MKQEPTKVNKPKKKLYPIYCKNKQNKVKAVCLNLSLSCFSVFIPGFEDWPAREKNSSYWRALVWAKCQQTPGRIENWSFWDYHHRPGRPGQRWTDVGKERWTEAVEWAPRRRRRWRPIWSWSRHSSLEETWSALGTDVYECRKATML